MCLNRTGAHLIDSAISKDSDDVERELLVNLLIFLQVGIRPIVGAFTLTLHLLN